MLAPEIHKSMTLSSCEEISVTVNEFGAVRNALKKFIHVGNQDKLNKSLSSAFSCKSDMLQSQIEVLETDFKAGNTLMAVPKIEMINKASSKGNNSIGSHHSVPPKVAGAVSESSDFNSSYDSSFLSASSSSYKSKQSSLNSFLSKAKSQSGSVQSFGSSLSQKKVPALPFMQKSNKKTVIFGKSSSKNSVASGLKGLISKHMTKSSSVLPIQKPINVKQTLDDSFASSSSFSEKSSLSLGKPKLATQLTEKPSLVTIVENIKAKHE